MSEGVGLTVMTPPSIFFTKQQAKLLHDFGMGMDILFSGGFDDFDIVTCTECGAVQLDYTEGGTCPTQCQQCNQWFNS